jgi:hypothetical protein
MTGGSISLSQHLEGSALEMGYTDTDRSWLRCRKERDTRCHHIYVKRASRVLSRCSGSGSYILSGVRIDQLVVPRLDFAAVPSIRLRDAFALAVRRLASSAVGRNQGERATVDTVHAPGTGTAARAVLCTGRRGGAPVRVHEAVRRRRRHAPRALPSTTSSVIRFGIAPGPHQRVVRRVQRLVRVVLVLSAPGVAVLGGRRAVRGRTASAALLVLLVAELSSDLDCS